VFEPGTRIIDYLRPLDSVERGLVIHGNYLDAEAIDYLAGHPQLFVVYCPRTHDHFGHCDHPWLELRRRGASVVFGTDGRGSNPDLSLWSELQFVANRHPDLEPGVILGMATRDAARALQLDERLGTLAVGKQADLTVISLSDDAADPYSNLFCHAHRVVAVMRGGAWLWSDLEAT
jgi:cytosine/adenosine deaminase-related metal-dependent hydrolase